MSSELRGRLVDELTEVQRQLASLQKPRRKRRALAVQQARSQNIRRLRDRLHELRRLLRRSDSFLDHRLRQMP